MVPRVLVPETPRVATFAVPRILVPDTPRVPAMIAFPELEMDARLEVPNTVKAPPILAALEIVNIFVFIVPVMTVLLNDPVTPKI